MSKKIIIALSGWKQSGKDSVADILLNCLFKNNNVYKTSFAEPVKHMILDIFGISDTCDTKEKKIDITSSIFGKPKTYRETCIFFAENMKKWLNTQDIWKTSLKNRVDRYFKESGDENTSIVIIPDVRYISELNLLDEYRKMGYDVKHYCIFRKTSVPKWAKNGIKPWEDKVYAKTHNIDRSEYEWCSKNLTFNGYIYNDGTLSDLENEVTKKIINTIIVK